jgi:hypothetical protein
VLTTPRSNVLASCGQFLPLVDSVHLDCICDAVTLLLAQAGVADVREPFAADWRFDLVGDEEELPRLDLPPADLADRLARRTGFALSWQRLISVEDALPRWRDLLAQNRPVLVVGDAFYLPWVPYAGHEHMDHGFVVEGIHDNTDVQLVDPYENTTEWGRAVPQTVTLSAGELARAITAGRWAVLTRTGEPRPVDVAAQLAENACAVDVNLRTFVEAHRAPDEPALANLTLSTWLLARNRALHRRWLVDVAPALEGLGLAGLPDRFEREVAQAWKRASEASYLALRRLRSGRAVPPIAVTAAEQATAAEAQIREYLRSRLARARC